MRRLQQSEVFGPFVSWSAPTQSQNAWECRQSAQEKGMDAFLQHVQQHANPVIARQIACVLKHWHGLETGEAAAEEEDDKPDDPQQDDDPQDAQTHVGDDTDEAESIHSWGKAYVLQCNS